MSLGQESSSHSRIKVEAVRACQWPTTRTQVKPFLGLVSWYQYCIWTDGLCALLGREMGSNLTCSDLDTLINMEMKLCHLHLENITIPEADQGGAGKCLQ